MLSVIECVNWRERVVVKEKKVLITILVLFLASVIAIQLFRPDGPVEVGREAPNFTLRDLDGGDVSLKEYRGKIVILDFWATWCGPCRMTMPIIDSLQEEYSGKVSVLAVNLQDPKSAVREYVLNQGLHSTVLLDEDGSVGRQYNTSYIPMQLIIDKNGIVRYIMTGVPSGMRSIMRVEINKLL